ncbi:hypothetical protein UFOVP783_64 [uncultured Caudovirales phage]|uniref:Uncharacterized protein n=1 Tax=uncultured Caudovirales phage TaxID=2100421 RepID=A0A6J5NRZ8_9CAUD|nr:hypothetical protein UFOVP783_64 [uncultured Caudovirales phage]
MIQLRNFIGNDDPEIELKLEEAINAASRMVDQRLGSSVWFQDYSASFYTVDPRDNIGAFIVLPFPIITLTELTQDGEALAGGAYGEVEDADYTFTVGTRTINSTGGFTGVIKIKGTFGYALDETDPDNLPPPTLHPDINDATIKAAAALSGLWKKTSRSFGGENETVLVQAVPNDVLARLRNMRLTSHRL